MSGGLNSSGKNTISIAAIELLGPAEVDELASDIARGCAKSDVDIQTVRRAGAADTIPDRRRRALSSAKGEVVLLVEDTTRLAEGCAGALLEAFADESVALAWGPVHVNEGLPPRYRALGRLEYGRFDGSRSAPWPPGSAFAARRTAVEKCLAEGEGIIEHELARRLSSRGMRVVHVPALRSAYARRDPQAARFKTRFDHGRIYGAGRQGSKADGLLRAALSMPVLSARALRAARAAGPASLWLAELPWILVLSAAWGAGEFTGQVFGVGSSAGSWN